MNEELSIGFLDISDVDETTFNKFMKNYKSDLEELCVTKTGEQTQNIFQLIPENYNDAKKTKSSYKIIYLYKSNDNQDNYEIVAFAIISNPDRFTTILEMLCSSKDKTISTNDKPLHIYLLDDIYSEYVENKKNILKIYIKPASSKELLPYYTNWKTPSLPIDWYNQGKTYGYLIYYSNDDIKKVADPQLEGLISDVRLFNSLCRELDITPSEVLRIQNKKDRKEFLASKIDEKFSKDDSRKYQLEQLLSRIDYFSVPDEIRNALILKGGTKSRRRTKRNRNRKTKRNRNRKTKRTRKTKYV